MPPKSFPPRHVDPLADVQHSSEDEQTDEEVDLTEIMNEMSTHERRKVYALKGLLHAHKGVRSSLRDELARLQQDFSVTSKRLFDIRHEIVSGLRDISPDEIASLAPPAAPEASQATEPTKKKGVKVVAPNDETRTRATTAAAADPHGGIPDFWLTAMTNTEVLDGMIRERDRPALSHLKDITSAYIDGEPGKGVVITFTFSPNAYFSNTELTKTYHMEFNEEDGDMEISRIEGCEIDWTSKKNNLTVEVKQKKQRNKASKEIRVVEREEKCESFFNFFTPPKENDEDGDEDEDEGFYEQEMEMDIEAGQILMEEVIPKAAHYYTGKSIEDVAKELHRQFGSASGADEDEEEETSEDEEAAVDFQHIVKRRGGGASPGNGRGRGGQAPQQQECKQQ